LADDFFSTFGQDQVASLVTGSAGMLDTVRMLSEDLSHVIFEFRSAPSLT